jgi:RNA polymerase sigma factor (sigma-70 family)
MITEQLHPGCAAPPRRRRAGKVIADVLADALAGDPHSWTRLVEEFGSMIRAVARSHRLDDDDAADIAQASWLALIEHGDKLKNPARVGAWLATTSRRECLRVLRRRERSQPLGDDELELPSAEMPPGHALFARERDNALWQSFGRLQPRDQALLRLLTADPRPAYEEIAASLDMPIGSIGPTRQRALVRLRQEFDRQGTLDLMTTGGSNGNA